MVVEGHWCQSHCTDQETEAQRDWLPQVPGGRDEGERRKEGRQGGRLHSCHFLPHPGVPPTSPRGCSPLLDGALEPRAPHTGLQGVIEGPGMGRQRFLWLHRHWLPHPVSGRERGPGVPIKGRGAASTLLNSLGARFVTWTQDLGRKGPREEGGAPPASRATASEPPKSVHESGVCVHTPRVCAAACIPGSCVLASPGI